MQITHCAARGDAEADLVRAAQAGSEHAFSELWRRSKPRLRRTAAHILRRPEDVEDTLQNASWKAFEHLSAFRNESSFNTWLTSIVTNQALMQLRELQRAKLIPIDELPGEQGAWTTVVRDRAPSPEEAFAGQEMMRALHREIRLLPAPLRQVMLLYVEDRSMVKAAERLGLTLAAAKTRLFRARQHLYRRMRRYTDSSVVAV